jgi:hypothetical protein
VNVEPEILIAAVDQTARAVLPPRGTDLPGAVRAPPARRLAERLYAIPGETWREALAEWPESGFFTSAIVRRILEAESPPVGAQLRQGLIDPRSPESLIYRTVKDAAFPAAFALGFAYGQQSHRNGR